MRIAQVAPLTERVPPLRYGGTERVVGTLTDALVRRGHDVTLFASGDSETTATLVPMAEQALWRIVDQTGHSNAIRTHLLAMLGDVYARAGDFDVIHSHVDEYALPFTRLTRTPTVHTIHCRLDLDPMPFVYDRMRGAHLVSVSSAQRAPLAHLHLDWAGTVHNGIPIENFQFSGEPGKYLVFVGRITPDKGPHHAVEIARKAGLPLKVAAAVHSVDFEFWEAVVRPLFDANDVEFLGEIADSEKSELFGGALATLFPSDWPEPFGLVMPESLACGTPVVALDRGAVREILEDGVDSFICPDAAAMAAAVERVAALDRAVCREHAGRFSADRLAEGYEQVYTNVIHDG